MKETMQRTKVTIPPLVRGSYSWYWMTTKAQPAGFPIHLGRMRVAWCDQSGLWLGNEPMSGTSILTCRTATPDEVDRRPQIVSATLAVPGAQVRHAAYVEDGE